MAKMVTFKELNVGDTFVHNTDCEIIKIDQTSYKRRKVNALVLEGPHKGKYTKFDDNDVITITQEQVVIWHEFI